MIVRVLVLLGAVAAAAPALALPVEVRHDPLACAPRDRYLHVSATASRPEDVATAELQFRTRPDGAWYGVPMFFEAGTWSARLPRPIAPLASFQYRILMTSANLEPAPTAAFEVLVDATGACGARADASLDSSIVVRVPPGAPLVPPVPAGFSPAGIVAAQEQMAPGGPSNGTPRWVKGLLGAGALAAVGAGVAGRSGEEEPLPGLDIPGFAFSHTVPVPGSEVALNRPGALMVFANMLREPEQPLDFTWRFELGPANLGFLPACATMSGEFRGARTPLGLVLAAPLLASGACGDRFNSTHVRLRFFVEGATVHDEIVAAPFRVVP